MRKRYDSGGGQYLPGAFGVLAINADRIPQRPIPCVCTINRTMKTYLVGGAVRDQLLDIPFNEKDWVVTGASPEAMLAAGFQPVNGDFPVFLHPDTGDEYALARRETKVGPGYQGFAVDAGMDVTLEQDLRRRDLTINAMALDQNGDLIDPYHGQEDLNDGLLRHVSSAFSEDPGAPAAHRPFCGQVGALGLQGGAWYPGADEKDGKVR